MDRKIWTTPFAIALMGGSALALVAGYAYGTNAIAVEENGYNAVIGLDNMAQPLDENLLIEANREPVTQVPVRTDTPAPPPPVDTREKVDEVPDVAPAEQAEPDEPPEVTVNESGDE